MNGAAQTRRITRSDLKLLNASIEALYTLQHAITQMSQQSQESERSVDESQWQHELVTIRQVCSSEPCGPITHDAQIANGSVMERVRMQRLRKELLKRSHVGETV